LLSTTKRLAITPSYISSPITHTETPFPANGFSISSHQHNTTLHEDITRIIFARSGDGIGMVHRISIDATISQGVSNRVKNLLSHPGRT
jgi:hypothetical protein